MLELVVRLATPLDYMSRQVLPQWIFDANRGGCQLDPSADVTPPVLNDSDLSTETSSSRAEDSDLDSSTGTHYDGHSSRRCDDEYCCLVRRLGDLSDLIREACVSNVIDFHIVHLWFTELFSPRGNRSVHF